MKIPETWKQYAVPFVVGAAFLALIWPTPYIIDDHRHPIWRISRFTGVRELATEDGWKSEKLVNEEHKKAEAATQAELDKALSQIKILPSADFKYAAVQNPTNWELKTSEYEGTHVEYYVVGEDGQEKFIGDQSLILLSMKEQSTSNVSVSYVNSPQAVVPL